MDNRQRGGASAAPLHLSCHPDTPAIDVADVSVTVDVNEDKILLGYSVTGMNRLVLPSGCSPKRTDGLWQTTCFELFVQGAGSSYREYNFSPSSAWAAYGFESYRAGMRDLDTDAPKISARREADRFVLSAELAIGPDAQAIGLSAVIEEADGTKSYWALAHPPGKPDFHHADCFALRLAAGEGI